MRKALLTLALLSLVATPALAVEYDGGPLTVISERTLSEGGGTLIGTAITPAYSNVTTFSGSGFAPGGAALQGANGITRLLADDLTPLPAFSGLAVTSFQFALVNLNTSAVSFRPRARFWNADGAGGLPGTYYSNPVAVGFTFNAVTINANSVVVFNTTLAPGQMNMPGSTFWAGMTFDNNSGATGATVAQLNNIGMAIFDPPTAGSSADVFFRTTLEGSFFNIASPAGATSNFSGTPVANFGWEFNVDNATDTQTSSWGRLKSLYR